MGKRLDLSGRRKDGTEFPAEISLSPMETDEGTFATAAIRDATRWETRERWNRALFLRKPFTMDALMRTIRRAWMRGHPVAGTNGP